MTIGGVPPQLSPLKRALFVGDMTSAPLGGPSRDRSKASPGLDKSTSWNGRPKFETSLNFREKMGKAKKKSGKRHPGNI